MSCFSSSFEMVPPLSRSTRLKISWNSESSSAVRCGCFRDSDAMEHRPPLPAAAVLAPEPTNTSSSKANLGLCQNSGKKQN